VNLGYGNTPSQTGIRSTVRAPSITSLPQLGNVAVVPISTSIKRGHYLPLGLIPLQSAHLWHLSMATCPYPSLCPELGCLTKTRLLQSINTSRCCPIPLPSQLTMASQQIQLLPQQMTGHPPLRHMGAHSESLCLLLMLHYADVISLSPPVIPGPGPAGSRESTPFPIPEFVGPRPSDSPGEFPVTEPTTPTKQEEETGWGSVPPSSPEVIRGRPTQPVVRGGGAVCGGRPIRRSSHLTFLSVGGGKSKSKHSYRLGRMNVLEGSISGSPEGEPRSLPRPPTPITSRVPSPSPG
jgi:hypothetical protein